MSRRLQPSVLAAVLLALSALLAAVVVFLTWPTRGTIFCEQLPQLTALAVCAATLLVFCFRTLSLTYAARRRGGPGDGRLPGGAAILAALAFFLAAHFIAQYRKPCVAVQRQIQGARQHPQTKSR